MGALAFIFFLLFLSVVWYRWYMKLEEKNQTKILEERKKMLVDTQALLTEAQKDEGYKRYKAAKFVGEDSENLDWKEWTEYLIQLLDELLLIDDEDRTLTLNNFQVDPESISLVWTVVAIKSMYREWWVIDKFTELWFVEKIEIPFYKEWKDWLTFTLTADIIEYEW